MVKKAKSKARSKRLAPVRLELHPYPCVVDLYQDDVSYTQACEDVGDDPSDMLEGALGMCVFDGSRTLMFIRPDRPKAQREETLVHEALHATLYSLEYCGIDPRSNSGECATYLQTYIFAELRKCL